MSFSNETPLRDRLAAAAPTLLVQAAVGYALLSGLAVTVFAPERPRPPLVTKNIPLPPEPLPEPPDQPRTTVAEARTLPHLPRPEVAAASQPSAPASSEPVFVDLGPAPVEITIPAEPARPAADLSRGVAARGNQGDWFPQDAYPAAARRAGAQGLVSVSVDVGERGRVTACRVTKSSGSDELDAATCRLATRNGRFAPALDPAGRPAAATYQLRNVRWVLEK